jgi:hypothetical protein
MMWRKKYHSLLLIVVIFSFQSLCCQEQGKVKDTARVYKAIENYSKGSKFKTFVYKLLFEPISNKKDTKVVVAKMKKQNYKKFEGKIIRRIRVTTLDPFSYSVIDTNQVPKKKLAKIGNSLHLKSKKFAVYNLLLFKKNKPLDSILVKESERLIRRQRFVRSVAITSTLVSKDSDSVDVSIRVLDSWSMAPDFTLSGSKSTFFFRERNFVGTGHEFATYLSKNLDGGDQGFGANYTIPTIKNTYIRTTLSYERDFDNNYKQFVNIERPFYSPVTKWAGGIYLDQVFEKEQAVNSSTDTILNSKSRVKDFWGGHSISIFKGNTEFERFTNFVVSARFLNKEYSELPILGIDSLGVFSKENLSLISFGISSRKYTQDKYIFNFNITEDIASGYTFSITTGSQNKNQSNRMYFGARAAYGNYFSFGYLSSNLEYGTFFEGRMTVQSAYNFNITYFSNLLDTGKWKFRQFIKPQAIIGTKRIDSNTDKITLNGENGIAGFNSSKIFGTKKLLLTFQTQGYSPWQVIGFRLNPFINYTLGMIGQPGKGFSNSKLYSEFGVGVIISNDYLVFSNFQFSLSFFPILPEDASNSYKSNSLKTYDFGLQEFDIAKPLLVRYQ